MTRPIGEILDSAPAVITGRQLRAARILAGMTRLELAKAAGLGRATLDVHEQRHEKPINSILETRLSLVEALWQAGVQLIAHEGVQRREAGNGE